MSDIVNKIDPFINFKLEEGEIIKPMYPIPTIVDIEPNRYYITSFGRIFATQYLGKYLLYEPKYSKTFDGYYMVNLYNTYKQKYCSYKVSRLVLFYFDSVPDDPTMYEANHLDYNRLNNHISNLNWLTHVENNKYSYCNQNRVKDEEIIDIYDRVNNKGQSYEEVAKYYGRAVDTIIGVARGNYYYRDKLIRLGLPILANSPVTNENAIEIYNRLLKGEDDKDLAKEYNLNKSTIRVGYPILKN